MSDDPSVLKTEAGEASIDETAAATLEEQLAAATAQKIRAKNINPN